MKKVITNLFSSERFTKVTLPILLVIILVVIGVWSFKNPIKTISPEAAKSRTESFINTYLMQSGNKATIKEVTTEYGLYKLKIDIVSDVIESYLTKDGKLFFPQAMDIDQIASKAKAQTAGGAAAQAAPVAQVTNKNDKPKVELFVMSYCPYGTQIEKGILPVVAALGNKIDFQTKFCSYAMHGEKEVVENLNQYCIEKEQPNKYSDYLKCFLDASDSAGCITKTGVNKSKMDSCVTKTDKKFSVLSDFTNKVNYQGSFPSFAVEKADNDKYNVGGSPTLIINGQEVSSNRDPESLLKTICSAFTNPPKECNATLSSDSPAPGFGSGTTSASSGAAGCAQQ
jgi:hypothetical protein